MTLVVDASVAVKWVVNETGSERARALVGTDRIAAPTILFAEVGNALWKLATRGTLTHRHAQTGLVALARAIDDLHPIDSLSLRALEIALTLGHPIYDCFYLALAEQVDALMVTADRRLLARLEGTDLRRLVTQLPA